MKEQLSALIDGEFEIDNAAHLLLAAKSEGELKQAWVCYHLIGDAMRGDLMPHNHMTSRVLELLDNEPTVLAPRAVANHKSVPDVKRVQKRPVVWSVAASVVAVMFVGLMLLQNQSVEQNLVSPMQLADAIPAEYFVAHQTYAPNHTAYYIQNASYIDQR